MAITYPRELPTVAGIMSIKIGAQNVVAMQESPFTYTQQVFSHAGQRWVAEVMLPPLDRPDAEEWVAWLVSMKGQAGTFLMGDPSAATNRGSASISPGTPIVSGASQTGPSLSISGCPSSASGYLKAGDYIQLGTGATTTLHKVLQAVNTAADGTATLDIWPSLRSSPANGAAVVISGAKGRWRVASSDHNWSISAAQHFGIQFSCVEAI